MRDDGLRVVPDPGPLMLGDRVIGIPGSVVAPILQGRRPLLVEVQALIGKTEAAKRPRAQGLDAARAGVLAAVLTSRAGVSFQKGELFVAAAGGVSVAEPAADLAVAVAMASAQRGTLVPPEIVVFGEIGLAGEVRTVPGTDRRLAEAWRCGFLGAVVPASTPDDAVPDGMRVCRVRNVADALEAASESQTGTMPSWLTATASRSTTRWP